MNLRTKIQTLLLLRKIIRTHKRYTRANQKLMAMARDEAVFDLLGPDMTYHVAGHRVHLRFDERANISTMITREILRGGSGISGRQLKLILADPKIDPKKVLAHAEESYEMRELASHVQMRTYPRVIVHKDRKK